MILRETDSPDSHLGYYRTSLDRSTRVNGLTEPTALLILVICFIEKRVPIGCWSTSLFDGEDTLPQHLFRLGYSRADHDHTPRWPLKAFLAEQT